MAVTFHLVCLGWLFFRAASVADAVEMLRSFGNPWQLSNMALTIAGLLAFYLTPLILFEWWIEKRGDLLALTKVKWPLRAAAYAGIILMLLYFAAPIRNDFIYFQF